MDTISLAGTLPAKLAAVRGAGFSQIMLSARDIVGHAEGIDAAVEAVRASGLRVTGFQVLRDFEGLSGHLHEYKIDVAKSMLEMCHALGATVLLVCSSTSTHATDDADALARDLRKLAMLAVPLGIKVAYEGLSWGRTINEFTSAWDIVRRADAPNLGIGIDSYHIFATKTPLDDLDMLDPDKIFLVQLADFMWQEVRTVEERIATARHFPRLSRRRRAQRRAGRAGDAAGPHRLPRRLQLRGLQRRLPADAAADRGGARAPLRALARRGRAAPLGAAAQQPAAAARAPEACCAGGRFATHVTRLFARPPHGAVVAATARPRGRGRPRGLRLCGPAFVAGDARRQGLSIDGRRGRCCARRSRA